MRVDATTNQMRNKRGAVGNKSSSSCSYATINKKEIGRRGALLLSGRWRCNGSPDDVGTAIEGVKAMTTKTQR
jgi:hypothetical protein